MTNPLRLKRAIDPSSNVNPDDVIVTKRSLSRLGHYEVTDFGLTRFPDAPLFDGIKSFQRDFGLKIDGIAKPEGPTIQTLGQRVSQLKSSVTPSGYQKAASKPDAPTPEECDHHFYKVDIPVRRAIERRRGKRAAARCYPSLSAIAREITGARWSGPRFFGIRQALKPFSSESMEAHNEQG